MKAAVCVALGLLMAAGIAGKGNAQPADKCLRLVVSATGKQAMWNRKADAEHSAIAAWTQKAQRQAGAAYSRWSNARRKKIACAPVSKSTIRCTASATPCR